MSRQSSLFDFEQAPTELTKHIHQEARENIDSGLEESLTFVPASCLYDIEKRERTAYNWSIAATESLEGSS